MNLHKTTIIIMLLFVVLNLSLISSNAHAENSDNAENSAFSIYLWGAGINGNLQDGSDIDVGFSDIISELDFAFMGTYETRGEDWSFVGDLVYLDITADDSVTLPGGNASINSDLKLKGTVVTLLAGYNLSDTGTNTADFIFGMRYFDVDTGVNINLNDNQGIGGSVADSVSDAIIGVRGELALNENWYMPYYFDIGAGQSDRTMQLLGGIGYKYSWGDLKLVYRYVDWELDSDSLLADINFNGPVLGATFHF